MITERIDLEAVSAATAHVVEIHKRLVDFIKVDMGLDKIDKFIETCLKDLNCKSAFLGYRHNLKVPPFPNQACISLNDCVVHGTVWEGPPKIQAGDVLKIDIGVVHKGWIGDAAWTYAIKEQSEEAKKLMDCGKKAIELGIDKLRPGNTLNDWAATVQAFAEDVCGFHIIRGIGGHGFGRKLHMTPHVANFVDELGWEDGDLVIEPGMLLAVEPMISSGSKFPYSSRGSWPVRTKDGSLSVHYEHDILTTDKDPMVFTKDLYLLPEIIG